MKLNPYLLKSTVVAALGDFSSDSTPASLPAPPEFAGLAAYWLHRILCIFPRCWYLGLSERRFPQSSMRKRAEPWEFLTLDHERFDLRNLSSSRGKVWLAIPSILLRDDGNSVRSGLILPPRNERSFAGRDATEAAHKFLRVNNSNSPERWGETRSELLVELLCDPITSTYARPAHVSPLHTGLCLSV